MTEETISETKSPIVFEYSEENYEIITEDDDMDFSIRNASSPHRKTSKTEPFSYDPEKHSFIPGDYNGDGIMDFILKENGKHTVFYTDESGDLRAVISEDAGVQIESEERLNNFFPSTFETEEGKILGRQGFCFCE